MMKPRLVATAAPRARWQPKRWQVGVGLFLIGATGWGYFLAHAHRPALWVGLSVVVVFTALRSWIRERVLAARIANGEQVIVHRWH